MVAGFRWNRPLPNEKQPKTLGPPSRQLSFHTTSILQSWPERSFDTYSKSSRQFH